MTSLALLIAALVAVQSLINGTLCASQEEKTHETSPYQQPELPEVRETDQPS